MKTWIEVHKDFWLIDADTQSPSRRVRIRTLRNGAWETSYCSLYRGQAEKVIDYAVQSGKTGGATAYCFEAVVSEMSEAVRERLAELHRSQHAPQNRL